MIKANEAVVGRVFNRKHGKGWAETVLTEEIVGKIFSGSSEYSLNDFEPIPLDAEWIKRLGFVFNRELDGWEKQNWLPFHVEKRTTLYEWYFLTTFKKDWKIGKFQYVHQLQNLYHSLTGEELTIDKTKEGE